ncbi:phosphoribosyltransferase [Methanobacterium sp.]|uniref:phosphoribosyltransferase n=1 Tax=Methanobacterium sp. TaxID=2164 RepID=UPI002ABB75D0|nr:phosphoribosyltransferase family protein [Methanobacterium sp.]MDY9923682.1 phosphoribosyltransferase family protein [Methanobacterium sp.]
MKSQKQNNFFEIPDLRNQVGVFRDREHAGEVLGDMLKEYKNTDAVVFAIPAGGVPVGAVIATKLQLPFEVAVVSKITLPWNTEAGYGAVAFDGTIRLNEGIISRLGLKDDVVQEGIEETLNKVKKRVSKFQRGRSSPQVAGRHVILVDDGIASGFTMLVAVEALKKADADQIIVAVPTAHWDAIRKVISDVDSLYCANLRSGWSFAVADAYIKWSDVSEEEVMGILKRF